MPVRYTPPTADQLLPVPGIRLGTAAAKIKKWDRDDVVLVVAERGTKAAGVFTQNRFCAAPVILCREHLVRQRATGGDFRALIVNAGNANAGTGPSGLKDAETTCATAARLVGCSAQEVLPYSTGVIMEPLPVERVVAGIDAAYANARSDGWYSAARAIMTTDTVPKATSRQIEIDGARVTVTGIAKGAGMIHPDMATMLGFMATDAPIDARLLDTLAHEVAERSFNCATVDGDTSTNDSFVIAATAKVPIASFTDAKDRRLAALRNTLVDAATELAQAIVRDGEGATKFITIAVERGRDVEECRRVAFAVAHSPLVKTAFFASDPNLGRIVCAIGNAASAGSDPSRISFSLDDVLVVDHGGRAASYREEDGQRVMRKDEIRVRIDLGRGEAQATVWTCDLSHEYVSINADYRS